MGYAVLACRAMLAVVFAFACVSKLRASAFEAFVATLRRLPGGDRRHVRPIAVAVVAGEAAIPVLLAVHQTAAAGFALAAGVLAVFSIAIATSVRRGVSVPCRCFGASTTPLSRRHLARNAVLLAVASTGAVATMAGVPTAVHPAGTAVSLAAAGCAAALAIGFDDIVQLFAGPPVAAGTDSSDTRMPVREPRR